MFRVRRDESKVGEALTEVAGHLVTAAGGLAAVLSPDPEARSAAVHTVQESDRAAEAAAHAVLRSLAASFVTPFDRADVFRVCWSLRRATARIDAVADTIDVLHVGELPPRAAELVQLLIRASEIIGASVPRLSDPDSMPARWIDLTVQIKRAGQARRHLLNDVTSAPTDEATLVRRVEVVSAMGRAVEAFEAVADAIQTVIVTES